MKSTSIFNLNKAFSLVEILLVVFLLSIFITVAAINFDGLLNNNSYKEAKESLKSYLIYNKHKAAFDQKQIELTITNFNSFTNDLTILDSSTKIVFFSDGTVQESFIVVSSIDGTITNKIVINVIGYVSETIPEETVFESREDRLPLEYEETF